ncbi:MAG: hypothetical protein ACRDIC_10245 [bacterium]
MREVDRIAATLIRWANESDAPVLALDRCGAIILADLGIPARAFHPAGLEYRSPFVTRFMIPLRTV